MANAHIKLIEKDPFLHLNVGKEWRQQGLWPCFWIDCPDAGDMPFVTAYRLNFTLQSNATIRAHVSADERYQLYLDGERIGSGPERGDPMNWFFQTYDLSISAGDHVFVARVWSLGEMAGHAQTSVHPGFLFSPEDEWAEKLGTGHAAWEAKRLEGYSFTTKGASFWREASSNIDARTYHWGVEYGAGDSWMPARKRHAAAGRFVDWELYKQHILTPSMLPPMIEQPIHGSSVRVVADVPTLDTTKIPVRVADNLSGEIERWQTWLDGNSDVTIPPNTTRRIIIALDNYYCAYSELAVSGGLNSTIRLHWSESLYENDNVYRPAKGNRSAIENKYFLGRGSIFACDGRANRVFAPLWWECGLYIELVVQTANESLTLHSLKLAETRYPLEMESRFETSNPRLAEILPILVRGVQMCSHETYHDGPFWEEMMYAGDTRLEMLMTYVMTRDDRLPRKALRIFDASRTPSGFTQSRYPARILQIIAPFCLWWVGMVHEYTLWRKDLAYVKSLLPGVRATLEAFQRYIGNDGLLHAPQGWNTLDWVPTWEAGNPPDATDGISGVINWQLIYTLGLAVELEKALGEPEFAARYERWASELTGRVHAAFWDEKRGLYADDVAHLHFSEHAQCFALLSGRLRDEYRARTAESLLTAPDLARTTIYFSHYLFETLRILNRVDVLFERLSLWYDLAKNGLKTPIESPEPTRSDCHGWGAHPLFHFFATILGIRPASNAFTTVEIAPQLGHLTYASSTMVHPRGEISVDFRVEKGELHGSIQLPDGVDGTLLWNGKTTVLSGGQTTTF